MPFYSYSHPKTGKIVEVMQKMNDEHIYIDNKGVKWNRVYTSPMAIVDGKIDAFNPREFVEKTKNKKGSLGDLWKLSAELSEKRGGGLDDPVRQKNFRKYEKEHGKKHSEEKTMLRKKQARENLKKKGITLSD